MPSKCRPEITAIRAQTERMINEAEKAIGEMPAAHALSGLSAGFEPETKRQAPRSAEHCVPRLTSARAAFAAAGKQRDLMMQRDGYVRAAFQAGQALSCARVQSIGKKLGHMPAPKRAKKKKKS